MKIIVDAMGGDLAPLEIVKGALQGQKKTGAEIVLTGDAVSILRALEQCGETTVPKGVEIVNTTETVEMCDDPATVFRRKKDTSMGVALTMLHDGKGDAVVSAGSTGALLTGATLIVKRVRGIRRAAMAPVIPTTTGQAVLIDCGANAECTPEYLLQFAYLGNFYAKYVLGLEQPRVGLLNIGAEDSKGTPLQKETLALLRRADGAGHLRFIGNIEAKEAIKGGCDVIVTDGFSGNILLKSMEGTGSFAGSALKGIFRRNLLTRLAALLVMSGLNEFKAKLDPNKVGGTAFIGISKPVIKAHGSSNAEAIENAVAQADSFARSGLIDAIERNVGLMSVEKEEIDESKK
ncbi:MAG: phosphate acyltransferase PlsX [Oscillospiraceae bacterium]|nr:phosphate acyltransferase PlsX [Oscillospiraceae bacterium]